SVSDTSGSLLAVVDSAGLAGFVVWMGICYGAIGRRFWAFSGCTCGKADGYGKRFDGSTVGRDGSPTTGVGGAGNGSRSSWKTVSRTKSGLLGVLKVFLSGNSASTSLTSLVRVFAWSLKQVIDVVADSSLTMALK
ncbi:hypothetical protein Tco_0324401, partial [Tanacetum coccineum]